MRDCISGKSDGLGALVSDEPSQREAMEEHLNDGAERASEFFLNDVVADILRDTADAFSGSEILVPNTSFSFLSDGIHSAGPFRFGPQSERAMAKADRLSVSTSSRALKLLRLLCW
jgi:hypothetical protein